MGNTHGVSNATKPPRKPRKNKDIIPFDSTLSSDIEEDVLQSVRGLLKFIVSMRILFETAAGAWTLPVNIFSGGEDSG